MSPRRSARAALVALVSCAGASTVPGCRPPPPDEDEIASARSYASEAKEGARLLVVVQPHVPREDPPPRQMSLAERDLGIDKLIEGREAMRAKQWSVAVRAFGEMGDPALDSPSRRARASAAFAAADARRGSRRPTGSGLSIDGGPASKSESLTLLARLDLEQSPPNFAEAKRLFDLALALRFDPATAARLAALPTASLPDKSALATPCTEGFPTIELLCRCLLREATPTECGNSPPKSCSLESNQAEGGALFAIRAGRDDRAEDGIAHFVASSHQGTFRAVRYLGKESQGTYRESRSDIELGPFEERKLGDRSVWLVHWRERFVSRWLVEREVETNESVAFCWPPTATSPARCPVDLVVGSTFLREPLVLADPPLDPARAARLAKVIEPAKRSAKVAFEIREDGVHATLQEGTLQDFPSGTTTAPHPW